MGAVIISSKYLLWYTCEGGVGYGDSYKFTEDIFHTKEVGFANVMGIRPTLHEHSIHFLFCHLCVPQRTLSLAVFCVIYFCLLLISICSTLQYTHVFDCNIHMYMYLIAVNMSPLYMYMYMYVQMPNVHVACFDILLYSPQQCIPFHFIMGNILLPW